MTCLTIAVHIMTDCVDGSIAPTPLTCIFYLVHHLNSIKYRKRKQGLVTSIYTIFSRNARDSLDCAWVLVLINRRFVDLYIVFTSTCKKQIFIWSMMIPVNAYMSSEFCMWITRAICNVPYYLIAETLS